MRKAIPCWGAALLAGVTVLVSADHAWACGGFFCDSPGAGTPPMPVDQTGETIVFAFDGEFVEAHIQISYTGDPQRFAWLIPLQTEPEVTVGSAQLFVNLLNATVPTVTTMTSFDSCFGSSGDSGGFNCAGGSDDEAAPTAGGFSGPGRGVGGQGTVPPLEQIKKSVGAFEVTILKGSSDAIESWLVDNNFLPDAEAPAIVDEYASRGYVFAAISLHAGAGLDELHPLVVRYRGTEPCIPLKLTAIAARENMAVRAFFLGQQRTVPIGEYRHVTLNQARIDWVGLGQNYTAAVSQAVDSPGADGHAFVTEYAGTSAVVDRSIGQPLWNAARFVTLRADQVVPELVAQGLLNCAGASVCEALHPLIFPLLRNYLPPPAGVGENEYWACVACRTDPNQPPPFDGAGFAHDFEERIVRPAQHAVDLLTRSSYVTRLFTAISPAEMTADPEFAELPPNHGLGDVSQSLSATDRTTCDGKNVVATSDGREAAHASGAPPVFSNAMPWAERVDEFTPEGTRIQVVDNGPAIDRELAAHNRALGYDPGSPERARLAETNDGACACQVRAASGHGAAFALLALFAALRRRASRKALMHRART